MSVQKISVATPDGFATIPAIVVGGLAYHHAPLARGHWDFDVWYVSHVASGLGVAPAYFLHPQSVQRYIEAILPLTDWTMSAEALHKKHGAKPRQRFRKAIIDAYLSSITEDERVELGHL